MKDLKPVTTMMATFPTPHRTHDEDLLNFPHNDDDGELPFVVIVTNQPKFLHQINQQGSRWRIACIITL